MEIKKADILKIFSQGEKEAPIEACGYLAGKENTVMKIFPMKNIDDSEEHFSLDPEEQFKVMREARSEGLEIIGVYHTHPNSPARPSVEDIRLAHDNTKIYIIASLLSGSKEIKAYKILEGNVKEKILMIGGD